MRFRARVALAAFVALGLVACSSKDSAAPPTPSTTAITGSITVSAASSLTGAFTTIGARFMRANPGATVTFNFGSSGVLATQIEQGAPVDTFAAADTVTMSTLAAASLVAGTPHVFARNRLVIVTKPGNPEGVRAVADLAGASTVALCATTAPCGKYAAQVLVNAGVTIPESGVTRGVDAKATIAAVATGGATSFNNAGNVVFASSLRNSTGADTVMGLFSDVGGSMSTIARGRLIAMQLDRVRAAAGVVAVLGHADIPGEKIIGPLMMRLMPAFASAGTLSTACSMLRSMRSRWFSSNSWPKFRGVPRSAQWVHVSS